MVADSLPAEVTEKEKILSTLNSDGDLECYSLPHLKRLARQNLVDKKALSYAAIVLVFDSLI